jgi:hypothetical protein
LDNPYDGVDFRLHPELYPIGRGEQGVFHAEPYKGELLPLWAFRDIETARVSAQAIYARFLEYRSAGDFVGMDMARKHLQMGYTRSRRYAAHPGGRKRDTEGRPLPPGPPDPAKAAAAEMFRERWRAAAEDPLYLRLKAEHQERRRRARKRGDLAR